MNTPPLPEFNSNTFDASLAALVNEGQGIIDRIDDPESLEFERQCLLNVFSAGIDLRLDFGGLQPHLDKKQEGYKSLSREELEEAIRYWSLNGEELSVKDHELAIELDYISSTRSTHLGLLKSDEKQIETNGLFDTKKQAQLRVLSNEYLEEFSQRRILSEMIDLLCVGEALNIDEATVELSIIEHQHDSEVEEKNEIAQKLMRDLLAISTKKSYDISSLPQHDDVSSLLSSVNWALANIITGNLLAYDFFTRQAQYRALEMNIDIRKFEIFFSGLLDDLTQEFLSDDEGDGDISNS